MIWVNKFKWQDTTLESILSQFVREMMTYNIENLWSSRPCIKKNLKWDEIFPRVCIYIYILSSGTTFWFSTLPISRSCQGWAATDLLDIEERILSFNRGARIGGTGDACGGAGGACDGAASFSLSLSSLIFPNKYQ